MHRISYNLLHNAPHIVTEYYQMPPLYKFDDYEKCLNEYSPEMRATYCVVRTEIKPDAKSKSWEIIEVCSIRILGDKLT